jgi:PKD repeat protein
VNAAGGRIVSDGTAGAGSRTITAAIENHGTIEVNHSLTVRNLDRIFTSTDSAARVVVAAGKELTINGGETFLAGPGFLGAGRIDLAGSPTLHVGAGDLVLATGGPQLTFSGDVTVRGPGKLINQSTLELSNDTFHADSTLDNRGTLLVAATGGSSNLNGTVVTTEDSIIRLPATGNGAHLNVASGFTNRGLIELSGGSWPVSLIFNAGSTPLVNAASCRIVSDGTDGAGSRTITAAIENHGKIEVNHSLTVRNDGRIFTNAGTVAVADTKTFSISSGVVSNFSSGTLTGGTYLLAGTWMFPNAAITTNAATIVLDGPNAKIVNQSGADALLGFVHNTSDGSFTVQNAHEYHARLPFTNAGDLTVGAGSNFNSANRYTQTAGTTTVVGTFNGADVMTVQSGVLRGTGTINGVVETAGTTSPGLSPGVLTIDSSFINSSYTAAPGGALVIELAGLEPGTGYDQLRVAGPVNLAGSSFILSASTGFPAGTTFTIIDNDGADPVISTFAGIPEGATIAKAGQHYIISYVGGDGNDVVLTQVDDRAPTAFFAPVEFALEGHAVIFDGSGSFDIDGDPITYFWTFGDGSTSNEVQPPQVYEAGGVYTVTLTVSDGQLSDSMSRTVTVQEVNDAPSFRLVESPNRTLAEDAGEQVEFGFAFDFRPSGLGPAEPNEASQQVAEYIVTTNNPGLFAAGPAIDAIGTLLYTTGANAFGSAAVTVRVRDTGGTANDGEDTSGPRSFTITVTPVNDPPIAVDDLVVTALERSVTIPVLANDSDIDPGDTLQIADIGFPVVIPAPIGDIVVLVGATQAPDFWTRRVGHGLVEIIPNADGPHELLYHPDTGFIGEDVFYYLAKDQSGALSEIAKVTIVVEQVISVTNGNDGGPGSLRAAIEYANVNPGTRIEFYIPGPAPYLPPGGTFPNDLVHPLPAVILTNPLPALIGNGTVITGATQTAFSGDRNLLGPDLVLDGYNLGAGGVGLHVLGDDITIRGIAFENFGDVGVRIGEDPFSATENTVVESSWFGVSLPTVNDVHIAGFTGIEVLEGAVGTVIGGLDGGQANVFAGLAGNGVQISGTIGGTGADASPRSILVANNLIGVLPDSTPLGNGNHGIVVTGLARQVRIGAADAGNVVGANHGSGVFISALVDPGDEYSVAVQGNWIEGNAGAGVSVFRIQEGFLRIGGDQPGQGNVIGANGQNGIHFEAVGPEFRTTAFDAEVLGNFIGITPAGGEFGNVGSGVHVESSRFISVGTTGFVPDYVPVGNTIGANTGYGVSIEYSAFISVSSNLIGTDSTGTLARGNFVGVLLGDGTRLATVVGNVISGNRRHGVQIWGPENFGGELGRNRIGVDANGHALSNGGYGVIVEEGAQGTTIGYSNDSIELPLSELEPLHYGNDISYNSEGGILIRGADTSNTFAAFNVVHENGGHGITVMETQTVSLYRNTITGSHGHGIYLTGGSLKTKIHENSIGASFRENWDKPFPLMPIFVPHLPFTLLDVNAWANQGHGVYIELSSFNTIANNLIAYNTGDGVFIPVATSVNTMFANSMFGNHGQGINLADGPGEDPDGRWPAPELTSVRYSESLVVNDDGTEQWVKNAIVKGHFVFPDPGDTSRGWFIDVYATVGSDANRVPVSDPSQTVLGPDPSGLGEGQLYVGSYTVSERFDYLLQKFIRDFSLVVPVPVLDGFGSLDKAGSKFERNS